MTIIYLTKAQLIEINAYAVAMVGGSNYGVLNESALDMVVQMPQQVVFGREIYPTLWLKASFLLQKITKKHIFSDGNKRTSIQATLYFLYLNGYEVKDVDLVNDSEEFLIAVTNSPDDENTMLEIAKWLENICERVK
jgi:death-on-curing protein